MYLKSLYIENFRKFIGQDNRIDFVYASDYTKDEKIDIAPKTTLLVGKNNSGKTTVVSALDKIINIKKFSSSDFNFNYLKKLLTLYTDDYLKQEVSKIELPTLSFKVVISMDTNQEDLLTNIMPFLSIGDVDENEITINIKWAVVDSTIFINALKVFISQTYKEQKFDKFLELIDKNDYEMSYFNINMDKQLGFSLSNLIEITPITANKIKNNKSLSTAFSKIVDYRYKHISDPMVSSKFDKEILEINSKLTELTRKNHTDNINDSIGKMILGDKCKILLKSDLNFQKLTQNVLKYEYMESSNNIPEHQFGLGYTNLMMIVAEIITYIEKFPLSSFNSQINLISIEEPETYMHPQMQELFIKNVNDMVSSLLISGDKHVNSQIIITTHSSHILNSKIHLGNTFNNINYITEKNGCAKAVPLNDKRVLDRSVLSTQVKKSEPEQLKDLKFLKKHIKSKVSELFFSDAVIFVEGITEYTILQHYIDNHEKLNKYYISILLVDGAHSKLYKGIIDSLDIPTLIITDIDIKRAENEKKEKTDDSTFSYLQIKLVEAKKRETTNDTLAFFYGTHKLKDIIEKGYWNEGRLMVLCQCKSIHKFIPTSFEEALILTNPTNQMVTSTIQHIKPDIYTDVVNDGGLVKNSFKLQKKLADSKSDFANTLLYKILTAETTTEIPTLPNYILDGLKFLQTKLEGK